jgi:hypothetical protein
MAFAYSEAADAPEQPDVIAFSAWIDAAVTENRGEDLIQYRRVAKRGQSVLVDRRLPSPRT